MSKIPYRAIPISLEEDPLWLALSLKRRALFLFLVSRCVAVELHSYQGINLTYGQYVWTYSKLTEDFNETVKVLEDQLSRSACERFVKDFVEKGFLKVEILGVVGRSKTLISITHPDTYKLIKQTDETLKQKSGTLVGRSTTSQVGRSENDEKQPEDSTETTIDNEDNHMSGTQRNSFKQKVWDGQQDLTRSYTKDSVLEDNVQTLPFSKNGNDGVDASHRFKLKDEQLIIYQWLTSQKIDSAESTLCFWAKNYSFKRLKDVHKAAVKAKPKKDGTKSVGALMNSFLKNDTPVDSDFSRENVEFMDGFKDRYPEMDWLIEKKYVTCIIRGIRKEIFLNINPQSFVDQLIMLEKQYKESKT